MCAALLLRWRGASSGGGECGWALRRMPSWATTVCGRRRGIDAARSVGLHCAATALWERGFATLWVVDGGLVRRAVVSLRFTGVKPVMRT
jgi:hypothetical protein